MRLFTGLDLPAEVTGNLEALLGRLRTSAHIQWSPLANLHITTKFLGEWPEEHLGDLKDGLASLSARPPIEVHIHRLGFFPNARALKVFWCGIEAPGLDALAAETDEATHRLGIAKEQRAFSPHLTLARIKDRPDLRRLQQTIEALASVDFGRFQADRFFLYRSQLQPRGSVYTKLSEFPFAKS